MSKRMTLLARRSDLTAEAFSAHWRTTHARIVCRMPKVAGYVQNLVQRRVLTVGNADDPFSVDGVVELWFTDRAAQAEAFASAAAKELPADERNFMRGITIFPVAEQRLGPAHNAVKLMMVARMPGGATDDQIDALAMGAGLCGGRLLAVNHLGDALWRENFWHEPKAPNLILEISFASVAEAARFGHQPEVAKLHGLILDDGGVLEAYIVQPRRIL